MRTTLAAATALGLALALPGCASKPSSASGKLQIVLPFIENDYRHALAQARSEKRPLFVEVWAPW